MMMRNFQTQQCHDVPPHGQREIDIFILARRIGESRQRSLLSSREWACLAFPVTPRTYASTFYEVARQRESTQTLT